MCTRLCEPINARCILLSGTCRLCMLLLIIITLKKINILEYALGEGEGVI